MRLRGHPALTLARSLGVMRSRPRPSRRRHAVQGETTGLDFDPLARDVIADPPAAYRRLHEHGPVHRCARRDLWTIVGYDAVRAGARARDGLSSAAGVTQMPARVPMMITTDRPDHDRLRRIVSPFFTRDAAERSRPLMESITDRAIDRLSGGSGADAVAELAIPLPVQVIAELLGVPAADLGRFRRWSERIVDGFHVDPSLASVPRGARVARNVVQLHSYLAGVFDRRRREPGDDLISLLLSSHDEGSLDDEELFWFVLLLLVAGNETTTGLIGMMLVALADNPDAYARLRGQPELVPSAVEESLRWASPIQGLFRTVCAGGHSVGSTRLPPGARVLLAFGAANRDPARYAEPDRFLVDRNPADHLGFGAGIHFCLGSHLARIEAAVVLERLIDRVAEIDLVGPLRWTSNPTVRGLVELPMRLTPA